MEWSQWYPLTIDFLDKHEPRNSGIYCIALKVSTVEYPKGVSSIIFIGSAPIRKLTERLKDHLRGWSNQCIYLHYHNGDTLQWQNLITEDVGNNDKIALDAFFVTYGALPECNQSTIRKPQPV